MSEPVPRGEAPAAPDDFLSGTSGQVFGIRATSKALVADALADARAVVLGQPWRLRRAARTTPRRRVLAIGVERAGEENLLADARTELERSHHEVHFDSTATGQLGKFENLNLLLARHSIKGYDWVLIVDDDVLMPKGFLDVFLFLVERFGIQLAQPAHRARSHAAWPLTRRRSGSVVRETGYVEIGPVVALQAATFEALLPFPALRAGWGLDAHWAALAQAHGWRLGIVDATPIQHQLRRIATFYNRDEAVAEGRRFLAERPYVKASDSQRTLATHRNWT
jgi:hypothetical protein